VGYRHLFESVKVFGKGIYFLRSTADRYELIEMNENLALTKRYLYKFKKVQKILVLILRCESLQIKTI